MPSTHSHLTPQGRAFWLTERLWAHAKYLPVREVAIADIAEFDNDCWFSGHHEPTCRAVAEHARRMFAADLSYPIILAASGRLMDGGHRIGKAWMEGRTTINAVRFETDPAPDWIEANATK